MKKFFTMALMSLAFVACNKEENKPETPKEETHLIEGTWLVESYGSHENGQIISVPADECHKKTSMTFSKGNLKVVHYRQEGEGNCVNYKNEEATYTISGDKVTLKSGEKEVVVPFSVDKNTLKWGHSILKRK